jgi:EmrB/QacA subfamily drug resistance transporter
MSLVETIVSRAKHRRVLLTLTAILFLTFLDTTIMSVALRDLQATLHTSITELQWIINAYALLFAALMLAFGTLGDRLGRKRVMLAGLVVFIAGSVFGALAPNTGSLIAARAIMGVGAAACEPGTLSIIRQLFPDSRDRARALGLWAAIAGLALAMGPVIGGVLVGLGGWPAIFWFNLAAGVAVFAAAWWVVPESSDPETGKTDIAGFILGPTALGTLVFAIILGETAGYTATHVLVLFAAAFVAFVLFTFAELRAKAPMLEVNYFRKLPFTGSLVVAFAAYFGVFSIFFLTALYLQVALEYTAFRTAALFVPMAVAMIVASSFAGKWVAFRGPRTPVTIGCLAAGAGVLLTDVALMGNVTFIPLVLSLTLAGIGFGIAVVPITSVALSSLPAKHSGMAASATTTVREVGTVIGVSALGSLFSTELTRSLTERLTALQVPVEFQDAIKTYVLTAKAPPGMEGVLEAAQQTYGPQVKQATDAALEAVHSGVSVSLLVAGCVILFSGLIAWITFSSLQDDPGLDCSGVQEPETGTE